MQCQITWKIAVLKESFPQEDFVSVSQESSKKAVQVGDEQPAFPDRSSGELLTCSNEGCVKMYQRHSSLVKHLSFGQCTMMPERHTLLDVAKTKYHACLVEGTSVAISQYMGKWMTPLKVPTYYPRAGP